MHYPLFLNLSGRRALIFGAGRVGRRKLASLLSCGLEEIAVLDIRPPAEGLLPLLVDERVRFRQLAAGEPLRIEDVHGMALAFAVSSDREANARLIRLCRKARVLCNAGDMPQEGDFHVPAQCRIGELTAAFSTGGLSPALAGRIRREAEEWLGSRFSPLLTVMGRLRPLVLGLGQSAEANAALFRALVLSPLGDLLSAGDRPAAGIALRELLPVELHSFIGELLHEPF